MGTYTKNTANRTPRPRSERLRRLGFIVSTSTSASSSAGYGDGHTHANLAALDAITVDDGYIYLSDSVKDETTDSVTKVTVKASAGFADRAGANADGYTLDWFIPVEVNGVLTLKLNPIYAGLWADGWLAAGGVGTGGSGGSGLIETVYTWTELQAMASAPADDVTAAVNARGVYEIWQAVKALQDEPAGIVSITSQQDGTVDFTFGNGDVTTVDLNHRHPDLEAAIAAIQSLEFVPVVALPTASEDTIGKIYLVPSSNPKTENVKDEYVTIRSGSEGAYTYSWEQIGTTAVDLTPYATKVTGATSGNFASLDASGNLVDSGHKHGDYVTALGTNGNYLTWTKNGVANDLTVPFATKATQDGDGNTISSTYLKLSGGTVTGNITASKFIKSGSSDSYVLLGGGGTKALSGFVTLDKPYQMPTNPFGGSSSSIHQNLTNDGMYAAHKRFNVTLTGLTGNASNLFDGNYETSCNISAGGTGTILIESDTPLFGTYTYGYTILSFYYTGIPESVSMRFYGNRGGTIGWYNANAASYYYGSSASTTNVALSIYNANTYSVSKIEITVTAKDSIATKITQIDHMFTRGATVYMSAVTKFPVKQDLWGPVEINNTLAVTSPITLSGTTNTARRIYFGDTSHYLELDQYGFHFSHGVYSDDFVSAGGIGSSSTSGGALADLADVSLSSGLASGDLLKYDGTHWVNIPQSQIVPTVSVAFDDLTSHPTTIAGYGITDAKIENGTITLGSNAITPLTSVPDLSNTYLSLANGGTVAGQVTFGEYIKGPSDIWFIGDDGVAEFASLTVNGSQVLTSHQTVTNLAATLTPGSTQTIATIGNTSITVKVPFFAMQQDIGTLNSYFTNGVANNAAQLDGHSASYFATAAALSGYVPTSRTINGVDLSQNRTFYALGTSLGTSAARGTMLGVSALSYDLSSTGSESSLIKWDTQLGAWHVYGNLFADGWIASGGIGTESGGGGYGVEEITSNQDGTVDFHFTGGDITTVDLNHEHPQYASKMAETSQPSGGFLPDVVYELGTLTGSVTFALASAVSGQVNHYFWTFTAGSTAPTVTWPSGITWADSAPTITAGNKYQISILDGVAAYMEA